MESEKDHSDQGAEAITLSVFEIDESENPRKNANPAWAELKDSISAVGLKSILVVKPEGDRYRLARGGNTRLRALKELVGAGRTDLERITVVVDRSDISRAGMVVDHLIENDLRGNMSYSDRAEALWRLKATIESEIGGLLSARALERELSARGYPMGRTAVTTYLFAAEELVPRMGRMSETLTQRMAVALRVELGAVRALWDRYEQQGYGEEGGWSQMVSAAFDELVADGAMSAAAVGHELCDIIADLADKSRDQVRHELEELRAGGRPAPTAAGPENDAVGVARERCRVLAERIAKRGGLDGAVLGIEDGMGFLVEQLPVSKPGLGAQELARQTETWLYLAAQSDVFRAPPEAISSWLQAGSPLMRLISESRFQHVPIEACRDFDELPAIGVIQAVELWSGDREMFRLRRELEDGCNELRGRVADLWSGRS